MVRIGFCGAGLIAWAHALGLEAMIKAGVIDADITAVHDRSERRAQRLAEWCGAEVVGDLGGLMARCDAVWVCTPTTAHREAVDEAIKADRAIFCEKPLATDLVTAQSLVDAVQVGGVAAQSGLVLRSAPVFRALRDLLASGELGRPMAAIFRDDQYFPIQGTYGSKWRSDVAQAGGGCLIEHSIHDVDILRFCFGEVAEVTARTSNFAGHVGIEDMAAVTMRFESGAHAQLTSVWHNILSRGSTRRIEIFCQDGMVRLSNEFRGPLHIQTSTAKEVRPCPSPQWVDDLPLGEDDAGIAVRAYAEEDRGFIDALTSGVAPEPSLTDALVAHVLVDAAYRSAAGDGAPVWPW